MHTAFKKERDMNEIQDWAEKAGMENIRFRLQNAETLAKEATSTLTILLAGMGGAMAYAIKGFEQLEPTSLTIGAAVLAGWLMLSAVLLVVFCMLTTDLPVPINEPQNLYQKGYSLDALKEVELRNLSERINQTAARNHRVSAWLDRTRLFAIISPLIFLLTSLAWAVR
jgi:hypothetical protein